MVELWLYSGATTPLICNYHLKSGLCLYNLFLSAMDIWVCVFPFRVLSLIPSFKLLP